jgi:hypothetical protein
MEKQKGFYLIKTNICVEGSILQLDGTKGCASEADTSIALSSQIGGCFSFSATLSMV